MFETVKAGNGVEYLRSTLLPCPHGFSTRIGGTSKLPYTAELNLAFERGDSDETVLENLRLFSEAVGFNDKKLISVPQLHSSDVRVVGEEHAGLGYYRVANEGYDGYISDTVGLPVGIKTADCVPVLFAWVKKSETGKAQVCAVGAVHAGWRGTVGGIAGACAGMLIVRGAKPNEIFAAIGPSIHSCCYQVGYNFYETVGRMMGFDICNKFVLPDKNTAGKYRADLPGINRRVLVESGIPEENIDVCDLCTCCHTELFYSHRASKGRRGTMCSVIMRP